MRVHCIKKETLQEIENAVNMWAQRHSALEIVDIQYRTGTRYGDPEYSVMIVYRIGEGK